MDFMDTDMDGDTTDETYYPFPSKFFALLYMLVKGTQQVVSWSMFLKISSKMSFFSFSFFFPFYCDRVNKL